MVAALGEAHLPILLRLRGVERLLDRASTVADEAGGGGTLDHAAHLSRCIVEEGLVLDGSGPCAGLEQLTRAEVEDQLGVGRGVRLLLDLNARVEAKHLEAHGDLAHTGLQRLHLDDLHAEVGKLHPELLAENAAGKLAQRGDATVGVGGKGVLASDDVLCLAGWTALGADARDVEKRVIGSDAIKHRLHRGAGDAQRSLRWRRWRLHARHVVRPLGE